MQEPAPPDERAFVLPGIDPLQEALHCREHLDLVNAIEYFDYCGRCSTAPDTAQAKAISAGIPPLFSTFMAKSGGTHLHNTLVRAVGAAEVFHSTQSPIQWEYGYLIPSWLRKFMLGGSACHTHMPATPYNLKVMHDLKVWRIWVHVRDPRQATLSAFHQSRGRGQGEGHIAEQRRSELREMSETQRKLGMTDESQLEFWPFYSGMLPYMKRWIDRWVLASELSWLDVLFTRHDDLVTDKQGMLRRAIEFLGGDPSLVPHRDERYPEDRFRKGAVDEWRTVTTREQQRQVTEITGTELLDRFGWTP